MVKDVNRNDSLSDDYRRLGVRRFECRQIVIRDAASHRAAALASQVLGDGIRPEAASELSALAISAYRLLDPRRRRDHLQRAQVGRIQSDDEDTIDFAERPRATFPPIVSIAAATQRYRLAESSGSFVATPGPPPVASLPDHPLTPTQRPPVRRSSDPNPIHRTFVNRYGVSFTAACVVLCLWFFRPGGFSEPAARSAGEPFARIDPTHASGAAATAIVADGEGPFAGPASDPIALPSGDPIEADSSNPSASSTIASAEPAKQPAPGRSGPEIVAVKQVVDPGEVVRLRLWWRPLIAGFADICSQVSRKVWHASAAPDQCLADGYRFAVDRLTSPSQSVWWSEFGIRLSESMLRREAFAESRSVMTAARSLPMSSEAERLALQADLERLQTQHDEAREIAARVVRSRELFADSSDTLLLRARYHCLMLRDWEKGLALVPVDARGRFARCAQREQKLELSDVTEVISVVNAWISVADSESGRSGESILLHVDDLLSACREDATNLQRLELDRLQATLRQRLQASAAGTL